MARWWTKWNFGSTEVVCSRERSQQRGGGANKQHTFESGRNTHTHTHKPLYFYLRFPTLTPARASLPRPPRLLPPPASCIHPSLCHSPSLSLTLPSALPSFISAPLYPSQPRLSCFHLRLTLTSIPASSSFFFPPSFRPTQHPPNSRSYRQTRQKHQEDAKWGRRKVGEGG